MTDRKGSRLRGNVKTCRTELDYVYPDHHWVMNTVDSFSAAGHLIERVHRNPDDSHSSLIFRYDEHQRILEMKQSSSRLGGHQLFAYQYDQLGRLERIVLHSEKDGNRVYESIQYAADGTRTLTEYPIPLPANGAVSMESALHQSLDATIIMTVFDVQDRPLRKVLYDEDERVIRRVGFLYDTRGLLVEEGELIGGRMREDFRNIFRYDAAQHQIEADRRCGDLGGTRHTFTYNDHGDVTQEDIEQHPGLLQEIAPAQNYTQRFTYQYDDRDNWTERSTETIPDGGAAQLSMIARRELAYY